MPSGTVSNLNERAFASIEAWRRRPPEGGYPHVLVDGIYPKRSWGGSCENVAVLVAAGVNSAGDREVIGCSEGTPSRGVLARVLLPAQGARALRCAARRRR